MGEVSSIKELPTVGTVMLVEKDGSRLGSIPLPASAGGSRQSLLLGRVGQDFTEAGAGCSTRVLHSRQGRRRITS